MARRLTRELCSFRRPASTPRMSNSLRRGEIHVAWRTSSPMMVQMRHLMLKVRKLPSICGRSERGRTAPSEQSTTARWRKQVCDDRSGKKRNLDEEIHEGRVDENVGGLRLRAQGLKVAADEEKEKGVRELPTRMASSSRTPDCKTEE